MERGTKVRGGAGGVAAVALAACLVAPAALEAQHAMPQLTRLEASDPVAQRALGLVEPMVAGDAAAAQAYLKAHTPAAELERLGREARPILEALLGKGFRVRDVVRAADHDDIVFVRLATPQGTAELVGVRTTMEEPYRILGLFHVRM